MLKEGLFKIQFTASSSYRSSVKFNESYFLPYRTEETHMHASSTVYKHAIKRIKEDIGDYYIEIKHIYELTDYEEIE